MLGLTKAGGKRQSDQTAASSVSSHLESHALRPVSFFRSLYPMPRGQIATIVADKGFGFIKPLEGGADLFFHHESIDCAFDLLVAGQDVEFEVDDKADKPRARQVKIQGELLKKSAASQGDRRGGPRRDRSPADGKRERGGRGFTGPGGARSGGRDRGARRPPVVQHGYVTKMLRKAQQGFISSDKGGAELMFDGRDVVGDKKYHQLQVGDYVQFEPTSEMVRMKFEDARRARSVRVIEKDIRKIPTKELPNNPKSRRKKPTWRR